MNDRKEFLVTGASGFFGGILKQRLLAEGFAVTNIDLVADADSHPALTSIQGDIRDAALLARTFAEHKFEAVFHCAAMLAHDVQDDNLLWSSNVDGTRLVAEAALAAGVTRFIFISTNCLWGEGLAREVTEQEVPAPVELYGHSKLAAEKQLDSLRSEHPELQVITLRCPTIMDSGRLGLLAILFEFIDDGKKVWVVGDGSNRYQFIYAQDLATACLQCLNYAGSNLFHIGSDQVPTMRGMYENVIRTAGSRSRVASLPKAPTIAMMKLAHKLNISPLGPYHYRMIAENFIFDTTRIRHELGWAPTFTNEQMLLRSFEYYREHRRAIHERTDVSAHSKAAPMGIIRLLKWLS
ncbi:NAD-dependent epimerase/dehydratase family protein [Granulicella mallensis]|uniref:NAD-dependent epimerase/dehydratase n=1 Tax=Granulicella mallensis (strain ATCC BAA-1857 / DSM 23137 / MP5ACTX8) TaxID=682795 RepID=G8NUX7_GRAMM|nr:NAD(P)-dependent oxidoreductase [Granulicella mallensis]AEU38747.1 NAD-dependent epimerase/dehydratase [Granulicella mallensis MP5ACTX8]